MKSPDCLMNWAQLTHKHTHTQSAGMIQPMGNWLNSSGLKQLALLTWTLLYQNK